MFYFTIFIVAVAISRICLLFMFEEGPLNMFTRIRNFAGVQYDDQGDPYAGGRKGYLLNQFAELISCPYCLSIWVGTFYTIIAFFSIDLAFWLALPFALSWSGVLGYYLFNWLIDQ